MNYEKLAFTDSVKKLQQLHGSRNSYARMEDRIIEGGLSESEQYFVGTRDSFYLASIGENGFPYIQHRGGPKGFVHVIDDKTLGLVEFSGNKQYISHGNILTRPNVSLFFMDYPRQARLKMFATAKLVEINDNPELFELIDPATYDHKSDRMVVFLIQGFSWNCPQHITARYTIEEIGQAFQERNLYVKRLEDEVEELRARLGIVSNE